MLGHKANWFPDRWALISIISHTLVLNLSTGLKMYKASLPSTTISTNICWHDFIGLCLQVHWDYFKSLCTELNVRDSWWKDFPHNVQRIWKKSFYTSVKYFHFLNFSNIYLMYIVISILLFARFYVVVLMTVINTFGLRSFCLIIIFS